MKLALLVTLLVLMPPAPGAARAPEPRDPVDDALAGFEDATVAERRDLAQVLALHGEQDAVPRACAILEAGEPDDAVRRSLIDFLARVDLGDARVEERAAALARAARTDPRPALVGHAVSALESMRHAAAGEALDGLVDALPAPHRADAARALDRTRVGREAIMRRIRLAAKGEAVPPTDVLAALVATSGRVLADRLDAGASAPDVAPFVALMRHPDGRVRLGARVGLENLVLRGAQWLETDRTEDVLDALEHAGWDARFLDYRRALDALRFGETPGRALGFARRLSSWADSRDERDARMHAFYGAYLEAVALVASGEPERAGPRLDDAAAVLGAVIRARYDLRPDFTEPADRRREEAVDYMRHAALVELMRAVTTIRAGTPADDHAVLAQLELAHARLVEAQAMAERAGVDLPCDLDAILDHELGPRRLLYENVSNPELTRDEGIELLRALGRGLTSVARTEMPGFEPFGGRSEVRRNPLADAERFGLYQRLFEAQQERNARDSQDPELSAREQRSRRVRWIQGERNRSQAYRDLEDGDAREEAWRFLLQLRDPSQLALRLARDLRDEGRAEETRELAERMLADLEESKLGWDRLEAEIGLAIASSYTEEGRPHEAEEVLLGVLETMEATRNQYVEARDTAREEGDAEREALCEAWISSTDLRIANCLVSLAVNANVRMGEPEKAVEYFERAFEIDQSDFMRALLACYRARQGRFEEARAELREVSPAPGLYYNMACSYALMGEADLALDFLQREFEENVQSRGALGRQKAWARDDPDLASLRDDPRFLRLTD